MHHLSISYIVSLTLDIAAMANAIVAMIFARRASRAAREAMERVSASLASREASA
jgi:hypothetical protein